MGEDSGGCPFRRFIRRLAGLDVSSNKDGVASSSQMNLSEESSMYSSSEEMGSARRNNGEMFMDAEEYVRDDGSLLSLQPWIFRRENYENDWERMTENAEISGNFVDELTERANGVHSEISPRITGIWNGLGRNRSSARSRRIHGYSMNPPVSVENCLIPQLFKDIEVEDYVLSSLPTSAAPFFRSFLVTDGNKVISKSSYNASGTSPRRLQKDAGGVASPVSYGDGSHKETNKVISGFIGSVIGVPPLPEARKIRKVRLGRLDGLHSENSPAMQQSQGSLDGLLLFGFGISIGVIFSILSNKREVEKLNNKLKHSKYLIQDLQEELEMKDSITVQQLSKEISEDQEPRLYCSRSEPVDSSPCQVQASHCITIRTDEEEQQHLYNSGENSDSLSKIEAELEAELERLEQNMKTSSLEDSMSALIELDADLIAEVVHGELGADMLAHGMQEDQTNANSSGTSSTNGHDANYAVSPKELSLRLHEIQQSRLEERIKELEQELHQNQRQLQLLEAEHVSSHVAFSSSEPGSSSNQESPRVMYQDGASIHPFCINLSGDALDAYNEAYEEFILMAEVEENLPSSTITSETIAVDTAYSSDLSVIWEHGTVKTSAYVKSSHKDATWKGNFDPIEGDEGDGDDFIIDEEEKQLIQQILDKRRQGSPVLFNAQMLLSMDE